VIIIVVVVIVVMIIMMIVVMFIMIVVVIMGMIVVVMGMLVGLCLQNSLRKLNSASHGQKIENQLIRNKNFKNTQYDKAHMMNCTPKKDLNNTTVQLRFNFSSLYGRD